MKMRTAMYFNYVTRAVAIRFFNCFYVLGLTIAESNQESLTGYIPSNLRFAGMRIDGANWKNKLFYVLGSTFAKS